MAKSKFAVLLALVLLFISSLPPAAFAQASANSTKIDLTPIIVALINLIFPAVAGIATYLVNNNLKNKQMATILSNAIDNSVGAVRNYALKTAQESPVDVGATGSPAINAGIQYVLNNAAEAITHFNIPQDRIAQKIEAKLGLAEIATNLAATASNVVPGAAGPLDPIPTC